MILGDEHGKVKLKCVAVVENFPRLVRETVNYIYVPSMEELRIQKWTNWRNSAGRILCIFNALDFKKMKIGEISG
jgi:hypothetical protein